MDIGATFRSLAFAIVFYVNTALFLLLGSPLLLGPRRWAMMGLAAHAHASLFWMRVIVGTRYEVRGLHNLPKGPALIASKHQSAWDTFGLVPLFRDPAIVMKAELRWIPFYGWFSRKFEHLFIERERGPSSLRALIASAKSRLAEGRDVVIFPEGTRRPPGAKPDYKPGVVALYETLEVPCVPVALNSGLFWPRRKLTFYPGTIIVEILEPIPPGLTRSEFRYELQHRIEEAADRLLWETASSPAAPALPAEARARLADLEH